jgi:anti-sigma regulatory factor (Ser/Thr protein kinase)
VEIKHHIALSVTEKSQAAQARRHAASLAGFLGLNKTDASNVAIIVTELAMNLVKHAANGELLLHGLKCENSVGIEVLALDRGPGMANVGQCLLDGYSSAGSPGTGLGAVQRLSTMFDVHSVPQLGTAVLARYWSNPKPERLSSDGMEVGAVCRPKPGEDACGDGWAMENVGNRTLILLADGLGHGLFAAEASQEAIRVFLRNSRLNPKEILRAIHDDLIGTRGAAVAVSEINLGSRLVQFSGVGNISGSILSRQGVRHMISHNGVVGGEIRRLETFTYPWPDNALMLMHSDGLTSHWNLERYPGILNKCSSLIAGVLYRDYFRRTDDVTVLVARSKD